jgi:hypothetical protein
VVASPESVRIIADLINLHPDRFLFRTDEVAPSTQEKYLKIYRQYQPLWEKLTPEASEKVRKGKYARLFDEARQKARKWEASQKSSDSSRLSPNEGVAATIP